MKTMDEARLKSLYRRHTDANRTVDADAMHEALSRHGFPDVEDTAIDRIAASSVQSDVLRLVMALGPDAEQLSRDVAAVRRDSQRSTRALPFLRRGLAVAAGVGALAVLFTLVHSGSQPGSIGHEMPVAGQSIMSGSFERGAESVQAEVEIQHAAPIFRGDFDS